MLNQLSGHHRDPVKLTCKINYHTGHLTENKGYCRALSWFLMMATQFLACRSPWWELRRGSRWEPYRVRRVGTQGNRQGYFSSRAWMIGVGGQESSADNRCCTVAQCHSPGYCLPIVWVGGIAMSAVLWPKRRPGLIFWMKPPNVWKV